MMIVNVQQFSFIIIGECWIIVKVVPSCQICYHFHNANLKSALDGETYFEVSFVKVTLSKNQWMQRLCRTDPDWSRDFIRDRKGSNPKISHIKIINSGSVLVG